MPMWHNRYVARCCAFPYGRVSPLKSSPLKSREPSNRGSYSYEYNLIINPLTW